ncbi:MAG: ABC transporter substrate-binding protein [Rhodobacteraceae bacterium]|nr:ABC transporter substrate-binding protein [Paracoccaceae bacterium]
MSVCAKVSKHLRVAGLAFGLLTGPVLGAPERVVSINLCTDQLAMMLAAPGQLVSVSMMAQEVESSAMAIEARAWPTNSGGAEAVFLLRPDLVLAGQYSTRAAVDMLRRLGVRVVQFAPEASFQDARDNIRKMGQVLGQQAKAEEMIARFNRDLARMTAPGKRPVRAALYAANGYSAGAGTLATEIMAAAGMINIAPSAGLSAGGTLPLERLVLAQPDVVIRAARYDGTSRAEEILDHPAFRALPTDADAVTGPEWVCGTPKLVHAVAAMVHVRNKIVANQ